MVPRMVKQHNDVDSNEIFNQLSVNSLTNFLELPLSQ
jgi:hypothetical protein